MTNHILKKIGVTVLGVVFAFGVVKVVSAQESGNAAAKAAFGQGEAAGKQQDYAKAVAFYRKAIELNPNFVEAHNSFMSMSRQAAIAGVKSDLPEEERNKQIKLAVEANQKELIALYEGWAQKNPKNPVYQWALGNLYLSKDYDKMEQYTLKAVSLNPKFARAYLTLSLISEVRGDKNKQQEFLKKASEADPKDASYAFYYANSLKNSNPVLYRKKALEVAERFPKDERGAQSLYWLAANSDKIEEKIAIYERLKSLFPPEKFGWSEGGMTSLFAVYNKTNPQKALALAEDMSKTLTAERDKKTWQERVNYLQNILKAQTLINEKKYAEATVLLEKTAPPRYLTVDVLYLLKAEALDGVGQTDKAYQGLLKLVSSEPTDALQAALIKYGAKLDKTAQQANADVLQLLEAKAKPVKEFALTRYENGKKVSLSDYRGKVVLLNFWYPFCGPCRGENPELQKVLEKYGPDKFVILAVNVHPEEDKFVLPYINGNDFGFIPLRGSQEFAEKEFQARGFPTNFLIDTKGRIVFKPSVIQGDELRKLELQIEALLPPQGN